MTFFEFSSRLFHNDVLLILNILGSVEIVVVDETVVVVVCVVLGLVVTVVAGIVVDVSECSVGVITLSSTISSKTALGF